MSACAYGLIVHVLYGGLGIIAVIIVVIKIVYINFNQSYAKLFAGCCLATKVFYRQVAGFGIGGGMSYHIWGRLMIK